MQQLEEIKVLSFDFNFIGCISSKKKKKNFIGCMAKAIICLSLAFVWQLYTIFILVGLHESVSRIRYSRYLQLAKVSFG